MREHEPQSWPRVLAELDQARAALQAGETWQLGQGVADYAREVAGGVVEEVERGEPLRDAAAKVIALSFAIGFKVGVRGS
jgi:hypothetical protein